jgi:hypothetical protein
MGRAILDRELRRVSARVTKSVARRFGDRLQIWQGCGYQKSGTTLLCHLMSSYLDLPYPRHYRLPIAMPSILQSHWMPYPDMPKAIYVVRDGRDVLVSRYFYEVHWSLAAGNQRATECRKRLAAIVGPDADLSDVRSNLPRFISAELSHPTLAKVSWHRHVNAWLSAPPERVATVRYEDLIVNVEDTLAPAFEQLTGVPTDREYLRLAASRFEFNRMAGQRTGGVSLGPYMRKGVSGDWRNHFSEEASRVFDEQAGETLRRLGYEDL